MNRFLCASAILLLLGACATPEPSIDTGADADVILGNLHRVDNARAALAFVDPTVDFARFNRIMLDELDLSNVEIIQPGASAGTRISRSWELEERDREFLRSAWREVMVRELESHGYPVVSEGGPNVLRVGAAVTTIAPTAARDDSSRAVGRTRIITDGAGSIGIAVMLFDGQTGEALALMKDARRASTNMWGLNNRVTNTADVRRIFASWARQFRARLDIIHG